MTQEPGPDDRVSVRKRAADGWPAGDPDHGHAPPSEDPVRSPTGRDRPGPACVVVLLRGAPGVGKSAVARRFIDRLGAGAVVEVDRFRAMLANCDWHDRTQHAAGMIAACGAARGFVDAGVTPVVIVDTFGRDGVSRARTLLAQAVARVRCVTLWADRETLVARLLRRAGGYSDAAQSRLINDEVRAVRPDGDVQIDTSALGIDDVVERVRTALGASAECNRNDGLDGRADDARTDEGT